MTRELCICERFIQKNPFLPPTVTLTGWQAHLHGIEVFSEGCDHDKTAVNVNTLMMCILIHIRVLRYTSKSHQIKIEVGQDQFKFFNT